MTVEDLGYIQILKVVGDMRTEMELRTFKLISAHENGVWVYEDKTNEQRLVPRVMFTDDIVIVIGIDEKESTLTKGTVLFIIDEGKDVVVPLIFLKYYLLDNKFDSLISEYLNITRRNQLGGKYIKVKINDGRFIINGIKININFSKKLLRDVKAYIQKERTNTSVIATNLETYMLTNLYKESKEWGYNLRISRPVNEEDIKI